jgi:hypothetical protein
MSLAPELPRTAGRYILPSGGPLSGDVVDLARPELRLELHSALHRAFDQHSRKERKCGQMQQRADPAAYYTSDPKTLLCWQSQIALPTRCDVCKDPPH